MNTPDFPLTEPSRPTMRLFAAIAPLALLLAADAGATPIQPLIDATPQGGALTLTTGTTYTGPALVSRTITIEGNGATIALTQPGQGNHVLGGGNMTLRNVTLEGGNTAFSFESGSTAVLRDVVVRDSANGLSIRTAPGPELHDVRITGVADSPIVVHAGGSLTADGLVVEGGQSALRMDRGNVTIRNSRFADTDAGFFFSGSVLLEDVEFEGVSGMILAGEVGAGNVTPLVIADGLTVRDCVEGIFLNGGRYEVRNSRFEGPVHGIYTNGLTGGSEEPSIIQHCHFEDTTGSAAVQNNGAGALVVEDSVFVRTHSAIQLNGATVLQAKRLHVDSRPLPAPAAGIGVDSGGSIHIEDSTVAGHLNSLGAMSDCTITAHRTLFLEPYFSGIIARDNTQIDIRHCEFIDNGQDGIWADVGNGIRPSGGIITDNRIVNAGIGEVYPPVGRFEQNGSGIGIEGGAWTIERNTITGSWDVGIALAKQADVALRHNAVHDNRLSGIVLDTPHPEPRIHEGNIVTGHTGPDQAGILVVGSGGRPVFRNSVVARNRAGVRFLAAGGQLTMEESSVLLNGGFGIDMLAGALTLRRSTIGNNGDWGVVLGGSTSGATIEECDIASHVSRGIYNNTSSAIPAPGLYWHGGTAAYDWNAPPTGRTGHHRIAATNPAPLPYRDVAHQQRTDSGIAAFSLGRTAQPWFAVPEATLAAPGASLHAARQAGVYTSPSLSGWGTPLEGGTVLVQATLPDAAGRVQLPVEVVMPGNSVPEAGALLLAEEAGGSLMPSGYVLRLPEDASRLRGTALVDAVHTGSLSLRLHFLPGEGAPELRRLLGLPDAPAGYTEWLERSADVNANGLIDAADVRARVAE